MRILRILVVLSMVCVTPRVHTALADDCFGHWCQPQQVRLSFGPDSSSGGSMVVTWSTLNLTASSTVEYAAGGGGSARVATGTAELFVDGGSLGLSQWIHRVSLPVEWGTQYSYRAGDPVSGWSSEFAFKSKRAPDDPTPQVVVVYGDLGDVNGRSVAAVQELVALGQAEWVLHPGDFAYDLDTDNGTVGDDWFRDMEPVMASVPYMVCAGNHESAYNFSHYANRFSMPGNASNQFYSFDVGLVHFVALTTEVLFFADEFPAGFADLQLAWLRGDLAAANANRDARPWVVAFFHRPMYCSSDNGDDCTFFNSTTRATFEDVLFEYGVDLVFCGHEHNYERLLPVYRGRLMNTSQDRPYENPAAPVQIISASAGNYEFLTNFTSAQPAWSAFRAAQYGFGTLTVYNATHLRWSQFADTYSYDDDASASPAPGVELVDDIVLVQEKHGPF